MLIGVGGTFALSVPMNWLMFLIIYIIAKVGYSSSLVFYDSMLTDITTPERMDTVSSHGYAWGYIGSCIPFIASLALILPAEKIGITTKFAFSLSLIITGLWWFLLTVPLLKSYKQNYYTETKTSLKTSGAELLETFGEIKKNPKVLLFLIAFFFYIDGVHTIINMAVAYGGSLGLDSSGLLLALLLTQIVAFPCALIFSKLSAKYSTSSLIKITIAAYFFITLYAVQLDKLSEFWALAVFVGMFQGAIQALSRSYYGKIIPPEKSGKYFGIYDICGKGAAFTGTFLISFISQLTGNQSAGIAALPILFLLGFILFRKSEAMD